jgi:glucokinase
MKILCFESGGTKLVAALADSKAQLVERQIRYRRPDQDAQKTISQLQAMGENLVAGKRIRAVGFGFGGTVRRSDGQPLECYHERGWETVNLRTSLIKAFHVPVFIENDCNLAALAEAHACSQQFDGTLLYVTIGTGIGGGLVKNGRLLQLSDLGEAEIGHLVVNPEGPICPCGNRGCLETLCSGPGLSNLAQQVIGRSLDAPVLMKAFHRGAEEATRVVSQAADYIGSAIAAASTLVAPTVVILGGGVMRDNHQFLEMIQDRAEHYIFPPFRRKGLRFKLSRLQEDVVCQGAAILCLHNLDALEVKSDI